MHVQLSQLSKQRGGSLAYGVDKYLSAEASDLGLPAGVWPEYVEVIDGDYVVDRYTDKKENWWADPCCDSLPDLLSVVYTSATGKKLILLND